MDDSDRLWLYIFIRSSDEHSPVSLHQFVTSPTTIPSNQGKDVLHHKVSQIVCSPDWVEIEFGADSTGLPAEIG